MTQRVTFGDVLSSWWPLAASWLMMGLELPAVSATMSRLASPEVSLAAYGGVVFPVALAIESPIIMLLAASTALSRNLEHYAKLRRFMLRTGGALTLLHLAVAATPLFDLVVGRLIDAPGETHPAARVGLLIMTPWTFSIAYRRFQQGVLIRFGRSRVVGAGTAVRLAAEAAVLLTFFFAELPGIVVGTTAVVVGVILEAIFIGVKVRKVVRQELPERGIGEAPLTTARLLEFYVPLALTSGLTILALPIGSAAMSRMPLALESLAVWPVLGGLTFTLRSLGFAFNEVVVALLDREGALRPLIRFTGMLSAVSSGILALIAVTPLCRVWFADVSGLSDPLAKLACGALWVAILIPGATVVQHFFQGVLVHSGRTRSITEAVIVYLVVTTGALVLGVALRSGTGLILATAATLAGVLSQTAWLALRARLAMRGLSGEPRAVRSLGSS
jgi:hypothetical protein